MRTYLATKSLLWRGFFFLCISVNYLNMHATLAFCITFGGRLDFTCSVKPLLCYLFFLCFQSVGIILSNMNFYFYFFS